MEKSPEPKRRNPAKTRARILEAAFELFAKHGYAKTGIREIAQKADIASSLLLRYFGSKSSLFEDALINAIYTHGFFIRDKENFGEKMAKFVVGGDAKLAAMMVLAIADPESKEVAKKITRHHVIERLAEWLGPPNAQTRALNLLVLLNGFTIQTRHLMSGRIPPDSVKWLARSLQNIVDGE